MSDATEAPLQAAPKSPRRAGGKRAKPPADTGLPETDPQEAASATTPPSVKRHATELAHATRGRVRLKIPAARNNPALLHQIRASFEGRPGIDAVNIKLNSGSLVIHYDPGHHPDMASLFAAVAQTGAPAVLPPVNGATPPQQKPKTRLDEIESAIEEEAEFLAEHSTLARSIVDAVKQLDREIKRTTNNTIDLKILAPVGLAAFTFLEIGAAAATPMWVTLVIFSVNHFVELRAHDGEGRAAPEPRRNRS